MLAELYFEGTADSKNMEWEVSVTNDLGLGQKLPIRLDLANHSPTGFAWGYNGSGPAQLALAILAYQYDDKTAMRYYQSFKERVITQFDKDKNWSLTTKQIEEVVVKIQTEFKTLWGET